MSSVEINSIVTFVIDDETRTGKLIAINSRYATVELDDGTAVKVGKTKIKAAEIKHKSTYDEFDHCPHCGLCLSNGYQTHTDLKMEGLPGCKEREYLCLGCGGEFGPKILKSSAVAAAPRDGYVPCRAYSGRMSLDCGDSVAMELRGKSLEETYAIAARVFKTSVTKLKVMYAHLNPGQQRMCLGNRLRKVARDAAK